jgi:hypothetical protein
MKHTLKGKYFTKEVWLDNVLIDIKPSQKYFYHSNEFNWGYPGSAPAQLALAIMLLTTNSAENHQKFKFEVISKLKPCSDFNIEFDLDSKEEKTRKEAINLALSVNKYLTLEYLQQKTNIELICFVHPDERRKLELEFGL